MKSIIQDLRKQPTETLVRRYQRVWGKPPRIRHREYLWKRIAWKIEERRTGGLSLKAKERLEELIQELDGTLGLRTVSGVLRPDASAQGRESRPPEFRPGTTLVRDWNDQRIIVRILEDGFEWNQERYGSLSAVAKAITGAHWNGRLFFGLKKRGATT